MIFFAIDAGFLPGPEGLGKVIGKTFTPAHHVYVSRISEHYSLEIVINGEKNSVSVEKDLYNQVAKGDLVNVKYVIGRLSEDIYIKSVSLR